ncbi:hypothetical protein FMUND_12193 [Fusarium mundagurra]|uniref:Uncharacterized protein n=1 Tax=Fusarium mundagurra TaxID=1567541 RepID=A0A8H5Y3C7_9HYPO|nr:hypothetical protein FMUND_12193 [Fusarium mundagurra]
MATNTSSNANTTVSTVTTVIRVEDLGNGKYELNEIQSDPFVPPESHSSNRKQVDVPLPVPGLGITVFLDIDDKEIGAYATMLGSQIGGSYKAGLDSGIEIGINLLLAKGTVRVFAKNSRVKLAYSLSAGLGPFATSHNDEVDLFGF